MLHDDLYTYLTGTSAIADLFPGGIHHMTMPQDVSTFPVLTFQKISHIEIADDMDAPNDAKLDQVAYQFDVISTNSSDGIAAADTFAGIFRNFRGTMTATRVQMIQLQNVNHFEDRRGDKLRRRVSLDFYLVFDV